MNGESWLTTGLLLVTTFYAVTTWKMLLHMRNEQQVRRDNAVRAVFFEIQDIERACPESENPLRDPIELPIAAWDSLKGELCAISEELLQGILSVYAGARKCNSHFRHWAPQTGAGENNIACQWTVEASRLRKTASEVAARLKIRVSA